MRYCEMDIMQRIKYLCNLYIDNYHSDSTVESIALSKYNSDVVLLNYTNKTIIVSYINEYTECEDRLAFTYWDNNKLVGYMGTLPFEYNIKNVSRDTIIKGVSLCEK